MGVIQTGIDEGVFLTPQRRRATVEVLILGLLSTGLLALFPRRPSFSSTCLAECARSARHFIRSPNLC